MLLTHGPPHGVLDLTSGHENAGCEDLRAALDRVRPRLHVFGHIHEGAGTQLVDRTLCVNASICTEEYAPTNPSDRRGCRAAGGGPCTVVSSRGLTIFADAPRRQARSGSASARRAEQREHA
ncbi:MAG: hypothetical protein R3F14_18060 [Polyangiaceae bacterium]